MTKTTKQITKVKLNNDGLKGMEVTYLFPEEKDNMIWNNEYVSKRKHPIHGDLEAAILDLRNFMLEICGFYVGEPDKSQKDYLIEDTKIIEISTNPNSFKISGELRVIGDKFIKISTPEVEVSDGYEHYEAVTSIIAKIVEETHEYMAGKKKMSENDFLAKFAKIKGDDVMIKELKHMSAKEKRDYYTKALEKMGAVVLIDEDSEITEEDAQLDIESNIVEAEEVEAEIIPISTPAAIEEPKQDFIPVPLSLPKF